MESKLSDTAPQLGELNETGDDTKLHVDGSSDDEMICFRRTRSPRSGATSLKYSSLSCIKIWPSILCFLILSQTAASRPGISFSSKSTRPSTLRECICAMPKVLKRSNSVEHPIATHQ